MSYTMKSSGRPIFKTVELQCPNCKYEEDQSIDCRGLEDDQITAASESFKCPSCDHEFMEKVWRTVPAAKMGNDRDPHNIKRMQNSFQQRFVKKDLDNVRHKFGKLFDDSLVSGAVAKAKAKS